MDKFRLITILNNDEVLNTGMKHHNAVIRRLKQEPKTMIRQLVDDIAEVDGFEHFEDDFAVFFCYYLFWQELSFTYNNLIESHKKNDSSRYPM
ncbi:MAG: hypothetical protein WBB36_02950 [Chitinophagales bacterium]